MKRLLYGLLGLLLVITASYAMTMTSSGGGFTRLNVQTFCPSGCTTTIAGGASGTYTPSNGLLWADIYCFGGGGGGGGAVFISGGSQSGGGGASGGMSRDIAAVTTAQTVTIGAGGTGAATAANDGGTGGSTSVGALCTAPGGPGGLHGDFSGASGPVSVGVGGQTATTGFVGDAFVRGQSGGGGYYASISTIRGYAGIGGSTWVGYGWPARNNQGVGVAGQGWASGGGGAQALNANTGSNGGADGYVAIVEYIR